MPVLSTSGFSTVVGISPPHTLALQPCARLTDTYSIVAPSARSVQPIAMSSIATPADGSANANEVLLRCSHQDAKMLWMAPAIAPMTMIDRWNPENEVGAAKDSHIKSHGPASEGRGGEGSPWHSCGHGWVMVLNLAFPFYGLPGKARGRDQSGGRGEPDSAW